MSPAERGMTSRIRSGGGGAARRGAVRLQPHAPPRTPPGGNGCFRAEVVFGPVPHGPVAGALTRIAGDGIFEWRDGDDEPLLIEYVGGETANVSCHLEVVTEGALGVVYRLVDDLATHGLDQWTSRRLAGEGGHTLDQLLMEVGIPFIAGDIGRPPLEGRHMEWAPGMAGVFEVTAYGGEIPYITQGRFEALCLRDGADAEAIVAEVRRHFGIGVVPRPHPTVAAMLGTAELRGEPNREERR